MGASICDTLDGSTQVGCRSGNAPNSREKEEVRETARSRPGRFLSGSPDRLGKEPPGQRRARPVGASGFVGSSERSRIPGADDIEAGKTRHQGVACTARPWGRGATLRVPRTTRRGPSTIVTVPDVWLATNRVPAAVAAMW